MLSRLVLPFYLLAILTAADIGDGGGDVTFAGAQDLNSLQPQTHVHATSEDEAFALAEFRELVSDIAYREFMKSDGYLIRWLKDTNFDVQEALENFLNFVEWRRANNVDWILFDDFSIVDKDHYFAFDSFDKEGRPVAWVPFGSFDIRKIVLTRGEDIYPRFMVRMYELVEFYMHELRATANSNATQFVAIYDLAGFNLKTGACFQCLKVIPDLISDFQQYPALFYKAFLINSPKIFDTPLSIGRSFMSESVRDSMAVYGYDKNEWMPALQEQINLDQLPVEYGGTRPSFHSKAAKTARVATFNSLLARAKESVLKDMGIDSHRAEFEPNHSTNTNPGHGFADSENEVQVQVTTEHQHRHHHHYEGSSLAPLPAHPSELNFKTRRPTVGSRTRTRIKSNGWKLIPSSSPCSLCLCFLVFMLLMLEQT